MLSADLIHKLAPRARDDYVAALTSADGWDTLTRYGVVENVNRFAAFMANVCEETGALTVFRESLSYSTPSRLRAVWPSRFGGKSDGELAPLLHNEKGLAALVYNGRMGNRPGTDDGYTYRGWCFLQATGRESTLRYCALANVNPEEDPAVFNDFDTALMVACAEWEEGGCNELADLGNFDGTCAVINVGDHRRVNAVVGLADRRRWHARIRSLFAADTALLDAPALQQPGARELPLSSASDYDPTVHDPDPHWTEVA